MLHVFSGSRFFSQGFSTFGDFPLICLPDQLDDLSFPGTLHLTFDLSCWPPLHSLCLQLTKGWDQGCAWCALKCYNYFNTSSNMKVKTIWAGLGWSYFLFLTLGNEPELSGRAQAFCAEGPKLVSSTIEESIIGEILYLESYSKSKQTVLALIDQWWDSVQGTFIDYISYGAPRDLQSFKLARSAPLHLCSAEASKAPRSFTGTKLLRAHMVHAALMQ